MESTFDVDSLQNAQFVESASTVYVPIPEGEFRAVVEKQVIRQAKSSIILDITWKIDDDAVTQATGIANPTVRQSVFLDMTDSGGLDFGKGKNVNLGRLREALHQNQNGQPWSFGMLVGQVAKVKVKQRIVAGETPDLDAIYTDVTGVVKLS